MPKKTSKLTDKRKAFIEEYPVDLNGTRAAQRAGYSQKTSYAIANKLLKDPEVKEELQKVMDARSERTKIDADYVLMTVKDTIERCRQAEPVLDKDGVKTGEYKFDANAVLKGCDLLGKHIKLWSDAPKIDLNINLSAMSDEELDEKIQEYESRLK